MQSIHTDRLILRPHTIHDVDASYEMNLDAEVSKYTHDGGVVSREEIERRIREHVLGDYEQYGYGRMAVTLKESSEFIGFCGLKYLDEHKFTDLGYRLKREHWGNGYATEAAKACLKYGFGALGLSEVFAFALPDNIGSIKVLEKLGFSFCEQVSEDGALANKYQLTANDFKS